MVHRELPRNTGAQGWRSPWKYLTPWRAVAVYVIAGLLWIALTDPLAGALVSDASRRGSIHVVLSWGFVGLSSVAVLSLVRRALDGLMGSERALRATVQSLPDPLLLVDLGGNIVDANRAALQMFALSDRADLPRDMQQLSERFDLRREDGSAFPPWSFFIGSASRGAAERRGAIFRRADGSDRCISVSMAPVQEQPGAPARMTVIALHDIQHLKDLERLRDDFLSIAAHELKTPVATVKGYAQLLQRAPRPAEASTRVLEVITRQCDRMDRMVRDLLELTRVTGARVRLTTELLDLTQLAADAADRMRVLTQKHRISLEGAGGAIISADRERLDQVLVNLLDNAIKFSPAGGDIAVRVERRAAEVVLSISDRGIGIPVERQGRLFERFYQAHAGELRNPGGMGVGLFLAREILALHGGRIWFQSAQGKGTTFFIALPEAAVEAPRAVAAS